MGMVRVRRPNAPDVMRCAYEYGLSAVSSTGNATKAKETFDRFAAENNTDCRIPHRRQNMSRWKGQQVEQTGLGSKGACVVALADVNDGILSRWEKRWKDQVASHYNRCWFVTGLGFFLAAIGCVARHSRDAEADARQVSHVNGLACRLME